MFGVWKFSRQAKRWDKLQYNVDKFYQSADWEAALVC